LRVVSEEIDALDSRLLLELRANPRVGVVEISRRLGVARGTVQARMDKLAARGVITGFGPEVEPAQMGYPVLAFISLEIVQGRLEEAVATLARVPEVLEVHGVTGDRDLLCRVVAATTRTCRTSSTRCCTPARSSARRARSR
jgi:DNA-binding Lrp family transcriptional regulator